MTLTIELPLEIEQKIRDEASARGVSEAAFVLDVLAEGLRHPAHCPPQSSVLPETEATLIQAINQGLSEKDWNRYHELVRKRQEGSLATSERAELIDVTERLESLHAERLRNLVRLAKLKKVPVEQLMDAMGLRNPGYA